MKKVGKGRLVAAPSKVAGLLCGLVLPLLSVPGAAGDNTSANPSVKVALLSMKTSLGEFRLGGPVVVSRQDIELPLARVRSPEFNELPDTARAPDPVFKGVYLTPREYTGRPSLPPAPPLPLDEPLPIAAAAKASVYTTASTGSVSPDPKSISTETKTAAPTETKTVAPSETKIVALGKPEPEADDDHFVGKHPPVSAPPRAKVQKVIQRPAAAKTAVAPPPAARKFTPADIGATRAFSRM